MTVFGIFILFAESGFASTFDIVNSGRLIAVEGTNSEETDNDSNFTFELGFFDGFLDGPTSSAGQDTTVSEAGISGLGSVIFDPPGVSGSATSLLVVQFTVSELTPVNLVGGIEVVFGVAPLVEVQASSVSLSSTTEVLFQSDPIQIAIDAGTLPAANDRLISIFNRFLLLEPDVSYTLEVNSEGSFSGESFGSIDWDVEMAPLPEPSLSVALGVGILMLAVRRKGLPKNRSDF